MTQGPACSEPVWTVDEASSYFTESGVPMNPGQLAGIIARLPGFPRAGRAPSGPSGGVGKATYKVAELMRLNARLAEWLV